jgi:hypothetical protein
MGCGKHGASDILADCDGATRDELDWCLKLAVAICCGEGTFEEHANDQATGATNAVKTLSSDWDDGGARDSSLLPLSWAFAIWARPHYPQVGGVAHDLFWVA